MTNEDLHDLATAYALDALGADERQQFETHLLGCERCRAALAALQETVAALAYATEGPVAPGELRERILVAARDEPPKVVALRSRRRRLYAGAALAAAACAGLAIGLWAALSGGGSSNKLALSVSVDRGIPQLAVSGLPAAPAGKAYEVWVIPAGKAPLPAGLFSGGGKVVVRLTRPLPRGATVAVTLERAGGVKAPTTPVLIATKLAT
jgi:anti-sigma-K factor RskA